MASKQVIDFASPIMGLDGEFNTFRLGLFYFKRLQAGQVCHLMDSKEKLLLGTAIVTHVEKGTLEEMLLKYGAHNHAVLNVCEEDRVGTLTQIITRIYGPHIATPSRKTTVIYLRRLT